MAATIRAQHRVPDIDSYLRRDSGLSPRRREAAAGGLPNSLFAVTLVNDDD